MHVIQKRDCRDKAIARFVSMTFSVMSLPLKEKTQPGKKVKMYFCIDDEDHIKFYPYHPLPFINR